MLSELAFADATDLADLIRRRELSAAELIDATIARIEALNPHLNAVVTPMFEQALTAARQVDRGLAASPAAGAPVIGAPVVDAPNAGAPFAGVPLLVKDLLATCAGVRHTNGSRALAGHVARADSALVARLRGAGLIPIGLTNTAELGGAPVTEGRLFGATRNPWDLALSPAGSSGGSAAAVAAGIVPIAHGNDMGGSLRNPASCCGVFALKPSRGRMPLEPTHGELMSRFAVEHALTRSVRDSARLLDHTHGALPGDPDSAPASAAGAFERALRAPVRRLRIALCTDTLTGAQPHPDCAAAAERAARLCAELGHDVEPARPNLDGPALVDAWFQLWGELIASLVLAAQTTVGRPLRADELEPRTWRWYRAGARRTAAERLRSLGVIEHGARAVFALLNDYDVLLTPTLALPAIPVGAFDGGGGDAGDAGGGEAVDEDVGAGVSASADTAPGETDDVERYMSFSPYTRIANITGAPAMSAPLHWTAAGIPVGAHFLGRMWEETTLLGLAHQLEQAAPWRERRPPVRVGVR